MPTAQKILNLLNREASSISELAARLGISRNSVYVQVTKMEAAGMIEVAGGESPKRVGKPAVRYRVAARHEDSFSAAYKPVLSGLVEAMRGRLAKEDRDRILQETGKILASASGLEPSLDLESDLDRALEAVNTLGAMAELSTDGGTPWIRCHTCPIATLVHQDASVCQLVASFFSAATDRPVEVRCRRKGTVVCGFSFGEREG